MDDATRELVRNRAGGRCEYGGIQQLAIAARFHVEHIIARQHQGTDDPSNLALSCDRCNFYKGTNLSAVDPETGKIVFLFHPRRDQWDLHFALESGRVVGRTDQGRATSRILNMNSPHRVQLRLELAYSPPPPRR